MRKSHSVLITSKKFTLQRDYKIHLQGIIDRIFREGNNLIPLELKTGPWKEKNSKTTSCEKKWLSIN